MHISGAIKHSTTADYDLIAKKVCHTFSGNLNQVLQPYAIPGYYSLAMQELSLFASIPLPLF